MENRVQGARRQTVPVTGQFHAQIRPTDRTLRGMMEDVGADEPGKELTGQAVF